MAMGETIDVQDMPEYLMGHGAPPPGSAQIAEGTFEEHEKRLLADAMAAASGNQSEAARGLRVGRDALRYKLKKHGLL
jgi:DNA-binding protein Fis